MQLIENSKIKNQLSASNGILNHVSDGIAKRLYHQYLRAISSDVEWRDQPANCEQASPWDQDQGQSPQDWSHACGVGRKQ